MPQANNPTDKVRQLQRALYCAAKASKTRRFHALYDKICRDDVLGRAWQKVRANQGAAGVDRRTIAYIEEEVGVGKFIQGLRDDLMGCRFRPYPVKRVYIPKPDGKRRPLGIPTVRDRVVQMATKIVIEPIFEADFLPCSYGFRPRRSTHQAITAIRQVVHQGHNWIVDADIEKYFDTINQQKLLALVAKRVSDRRVLKLIRLFLKSEILEDGQTRSSIAGTPQGGVISPLLANVYLHFLDRVWAERCQALGTLIRYADDLVIVCRTKGAALESHRRLGLILDRLDLRLHATKTRVVGLFDGLDGFDFLGFHHRKCLSWRTGKYYLFSWPSKRAMLAIRSKIRELTPKSQSPHLSMPEVVERLNPVLRGWGQYFSGGNPTRQFKAVDFYVRDRLLAFLAKKHNKGWAWAGRLKLDPRTWGLYKLVGTVCRPLQADR